VACNGVHGANRLASNSLLEGVVFGARAGRAMRQYRAVSGHCVPKTEEAFPEIEESTLRGLTWDHCGIVRNGEDLERGIGALDVTTRPLAVPSRADQELRNMHAVAGLIARCALARQESRGAHYRTDYPDKQREFQKHSVVKRGAEIEFRNFVTKD
jgi:L-aspartate oxidase